MARPIWSGTISFGLVSIPVKLFNAVSKKSVSFNQIDSRTGSRIKLKKVSALDGSDVPDGVIVKGYEIAKDRYVTVEPEELDSLDPEATRTIDIEEFVDLDQIDPLYYDSPYYLAPDKAATKPYALLAKAMEGSNKVAIARFVMRSKQYLAAIRPADGRLLLSTMVYADEVVSVDDVGELDKVEGIEVSDKELAMASQLIESLAGEFQPEKFQDTYREKVLELIEKKAQGEEIEVIAPAASSPKVVDLLAALEESVKAAKEARGRHPSTHQPGESAGPADRKRAPAAKKATAAAKKKAATAEPEVAKEPARRRKSA
ncbi:MAG: Ku protein [Acidimicrobiia bacterium]